MKKKYKSKKEKGRKRGPGLLQDVPPLCRQCKRWPPTLPTAAVHVHGFVCMFVGTARTKTHSAAVLQVRDSVCRASERTGLGNITSAELFATVTMMSCVSHKLCLVRSLVCWLTPCQLLLLAWGAAPFDLHTVGTHQFQRL